MGNIYKRFFRVTSGPLLDEIEKVYEHRENASDAIRAMADELGATDARVYRCGGVAGFVFNSPPDAKVWKRTKVGAYYPKQNIKAGRELHKRIKALPNHPDVDSALKVVGLPHDFPLLIDGGVGYHATLSGSQKLGVWFVSVPWRDIDPAELKQYKKDRANGTHFSISMDHLCWEPPAEFEEVKEWQVLKELDEIRQQLKGDES